MRSRFEQYGITPDLLPEDLSFTDLSNQTDAVSIGEIEGALEHLVPHHCGHSLVRIGGAGDGGYMLPDDLKGIDVCFSPGVSNSKKFEDHLAISYGIRSLMCDFTSDSTKFSTPLIAGLQQFEKKWLDVVADRDNLDINQWVEANASPSHDALLQIDVEGAEYRNLMHASEETLERFRIVVIEFHGLHLLNEASFLKGIFNPVIHKLAQHFVCTHVHGNNCCGTTRYGERWLVPNVLEVTYLRKDRVLPDRSKLLIPHPEDDINVSKNPPVRLDGPWLRNADAVSSEMSYLRHSVDWMKFQIVESQFTQQKLQIQLYGCGRQIQSQLRNRFEMLKNIAIGGKAIQSSMSKHSTAEGANGAINGIKTGRFGIHTEVENNPWWMVDLQEAFEIHGIVIYNRMDLHPERSDSLKVMISRDGANWKKIYNHSGRPTFGGYISEDSGIPLSINAKLKHARFVKLECTGLTCIHLDEVEIYGRTPFHGAGPNFP